MHDRDSAFNDMRQPDGINLLDQLQMSAHFKYTRLSMEHLSDLGNTAKIPRGYVDYMRTPSHRASSYTCLGANNSCLSYSAV
jgi:hypothetical protein